MKKINKGNPPVEFNSWLQLQNDEWVPTYGVMPTEIKDALRAALSEEQAALCCYCESDTNCLGSHIEHFIPQAHDPDKSLNYDNLLLSCLRNPEAGAPLHCGMLKSDSLLNIPSPVQADLSTRLEFYGNGAVAARSSDDGEITEAIEILGLNIGKLRRLREAAIDTLINLSEQEVGSYLISETTPAYLSALTAVFRR